MKNVFHIVTALVFALTMLTGCGPSPDEARQYNDKLIGIQSSVVKPILAFYDALSTNDKAQIDAAYAVSVKACNDGVESIKKEAAFNGDDSIRQKLQTLLEFYKSMVEIEFKELIGILAKGTEMTPEDQKRIEAIKTSISERETKIDNEVQAAQKAFTEKYGFRVEESELQKDIDNVGK